MENTNTGLLFAFTIGLAVLAGVIDAARRREDANPILRFLAGFNIFAAALLVFMTWALLSGAFNGRIIGGAAFIPATLIFAVGLCVVWIKWGLVPTSGPLGPSGKSVIGHILVALGTILHGSVTFYSPILVWLGLVPRDWTAVSPWLAIYTIPIALLAGVLGAAFIWGSGTGRKYRRGGAP